MIPCIANTIIQGDCTEVARTVPAASIDFVLTDPPYGVRYKDRAGRTIANDGGLGNILGAFDDLYRVLKPNRFCVSYYGWNRIIASRRVRYPFRALAAQLAHCVCAEEDP